jgi:8-oxo-dGTP diphosphatase
LSGRRVVVTADRELRERCVAAGAEICGPGWLLGLLPG